MTLKYLFILIIGIFSLKNVISSTTCKPKVAVIGAGIGGASASHFLTELFDKNVDIDVFESNKIGGRLATIDIGGAEYEAGGSIIHERNKYMTDFVKLLNLKHREPLMGNSKFGIWNGNEIVFEESSWQSVTLMKLLYRYGLQPIYLHNHVTGVLNDFENIYLHQDTGIGFDNVTALIASMNKDFVELLETSMYDHLVSLDYSEKIIKELVKATIVVNYGQDVDIPAFVGLVSVAGAGFNLWSVEGGNKKVPESLLSRNKKVTIISSTVKKIHRHSVENGPKYEVFHKKIDDKSETSNTYDIVIIAAPMTSDLDNTITFSGFENLNLQFPGEFQTTIASFVSGDANYSYFGLDDDLAGVMSCDPDKTKVSSIGELSSVQGKKDSNKVYKIFSRHELDDIKKMFSKMDDIKEIKWKAYPHYASTKRLDKFKLDDFMYHVNAIEWAASAMEMSAIGGRNVAILAFNDYKEKCSSFASFNQSESDETQTHSSEL